MSAATRRTAPKPVIVSTGPFSGMRDSLDPGANQPDVATLLLNVYPVNPFGPSALTGRPGFQTSGGSALAGGGKVQFVAQFTKLDGTEYTFTIVGGRFYTFDWSSRVWTEVLTSTDFSGASIAVDPSAKISAVTFSNKLIVSDGVNTPWAWDGTSHGGLTKLTAAPVFYGPMVIYYAKLFGIKASDRKTIVWSEENDPTTGYESGFTNVWSLIQTDANPLTALCGTNDALYYFRARSIGAISGPVASNFSTTGTREGVDETVGTVSPWAIVERNRQVFFLDADGQPQVITPGLGVMPLWSDVRETVRTIARASLTAAQAVNHLAVGLILFAVPLSSDTIPRTILAFNPHSQPARAAGLWNNILCRSLNIVKDASGNPTVMHGADDGWVYDHGSPSGTIWDDGMATGTVPITHQVISGALGYNEVSSVSYDRVDFTFRVPSPMSRISVSTETPRGVSTPITVAVTNPGLVAWDLAVWDNAKWPIGAPEAHGAVGVSSAMEARWLRIYMTHQVLGEQFGLMTMTARGRFGSNAPSLP